MAVRKYVSTSATKEFVMGFVCPYCGHINLKPANLSRSGVSKKYIQATDEKMVAEAHKNAADNAEEAFSYYRNEMNKQRVINNVTGACDKCLKTINWNTGNLYIKLRKNVSGFKGIMVALLFIASLVCMLKSGHSIILPVVTVWAVISVLGILCISIIENNKINKSSNEDAIEKNYKNINYPVVLRKDEIDDYQDWCTHNGEYTFADVSNSVPDPKKSNTGMVIHYYLRCVLHLLLFGSLFVFIVKMDQGSWKSFEIVSEISAGIFLVSVIALRVQKSAKGF